MHFELSEQERTLAQQGHPIDIIDPQTAEAYVLITRDRFEPMRALLAQHAERAAVADVQIPEGIRCSQEAFRRALPRLLQQTPFLRHWVAYHRDEQIGIARMGQTLYDECSRRGLKDDEFYVGWIDACELIEEEEIEPRLHHYVEINHENS
jgi:hypothetical protein